MTISLLYFFPGSQALQVREDRPGAVKGRLERQSSAHHVFLQAGDREVRGLGASDQSGTIRTQG